MQNIKIGIIGSGLVGGNLGINLAQAGYPVMFSSRHPENLTPLLQKAGSNAQIGSVSEASEFGDVLALAVPFGAIPEIKPAIGDIRGKIIWDITNPFPTRDGKVARVAVENPEFMASEYTAATFPEAKLVKALNTIYYKNLRYLAFPSADYRMAVPMAGNETNSKLVIAKLLTDMGFEPVDLGDLKQSRIMEPYKLLYDKALSRDELLELLAS